MTQDDIFQKVKATLVDALNRDDDEVTSASRLQADLGAESIDFLDLVFRLERAFKIKIPRGKIVEDSRGTLSEAEFEQKGLVTDRGLSQLKAFLSEVPADRFRTPLKVAEIPRLFTAETFCKLVIRAQRATPST